MKKLTKEQFENLSEHEFKELIAYRGINTIFYRDISIMNSFDFKIKLKNENDYHNLTSETFSKISEGKFNYEINRHLIDSREEIADIQAAYQNMNTKIRQEIAEDLLKDFKNNLSKNFDDLGNTIRDIKRKTDNISDINHTDIENSLKSIKGMAKLFDSIM